VRARIVQIVLEVTEGPHCGQTFTFDAHDNFIVGRARCAHFRLPKKDPYFSRVHFMIEVNPPYCYLMDMGSTNGTRVNGERVQAAYLGDGDLIQGGDTALRVSLVGQPEEAVGELPCRPPPLPVQPEPPRVELPSDESEHPFVGRARPEPPVAPPPEMAVPPPAAPPGANEGPRSSADDPRFEMTQSFQGVPAEIPVKPPTVVPLAAEDKPAVPGYEIVGKLGCGGMGVVYLASRLSDGEQVAVKTIAVATSAPHRDTQRFLREANILRQLRHPHIVGFHETDRVAELLYFVMDYVPGTDADTLLRCQSPLPIARAVRLVCQALEGLHYAHDQGFVHRDVKPANLLVTQQGGRETCRLADFGLARAYQASAMSGITILGDTGGTIPFMPPEQITHYREATPAADQYSAAATLYRLLTGRHLFDFGKLPPHQRLKKILFDEPKPIRRHRRDVPEELARAIHQALSKDPAARFPDAASCRSALLPYSQ